MYDLVEERRLVVVHSFENCPHECFPDKATFISDAVLLTETL